MVENPYGFTGRRIDKESGLYYYRARYYSSQLGRFLETDPMEYVDSFNLYAYVCNNPVNWFDPLGLEKKHQDYLDWLAWFLNRLVYRLSTPPGAPEPAGSGWDSPDGPTFPKKPKDSDLIA